MGEKILLSESSGKVARTAPRIVTPNDPNERHGCPTVAEQLPGLRRFRLMLAIFPSMFAGIGQHLSNFDQHSPMLA